MLNDTSPNQSPQNLEEIKKKILAEQDALIEKLKTKYPAAYNYLVTTGADLRRLQLYPKNLAAALIIAQQTMSAAPMPVPQPTPSQQPHVQIKVKSTADPRMAQQIKEVWSKYGNLITETGEKYHIQPKIIFATIMTESEGNPQAYRYESHIDDASYGLGQILYTTAKGLGFSGKPEILYDPAVNIDLIAKYHKRTLDDNGWSINLQQLIQGYNAGDINAPAYPGHLERFYEWYYLVDDNTLAMANK